MGEDNLTLKQKIEDIQEELNLLLCENHLKIDFNIYDMSNLSNGTYSRVKLKVYKEVI